MDSPSAIPEEHKQLVARGINLPAARAPPRLDPALVAHQIAVEDDERGFEHNNYWTSCCLRMDKRAVAYFGQMGISAAIIGFTIGMMSVYKDCDTFSRYSPLLTLVVGVWLPQPQLRAPE